MRNPRQGDGIAHIATDLGVARHELARVILKHIPNGKIHIQEHDAVNPLRPLEGDVTASFGRMIRESRKARRWTQVHLAENTGALLGRKVPPLVVTRIELGKRPTPLDEVVALAHLLDLSIDALVKASTASQDGEVSP